MKHTLLTATFAVATLFILQPATANPPRDISAEIATLRPTIVSARLYALSDKVSYRTTRHEANVAQGCYYGGTGDELASLLDLLISAGMKETAPTTDAFEARIVIYLTTQDGTTLPIVLTKESNVPAWGFYEHTVPVAARTGFGPALHAWERHHTLTNPIPGPCNTLFPAYQ